MLKFLTTDLHRLAYLLLGATGIMLLTFLTNWAQAAHLQWTASDFLVAAFLLLAFIASLESILRMAASTRSRLILAAGMAVLFTILWIELAIGLID